MTCKVLLHHYGRFTSPPRRSFVGGLVATVDPVELEKISTIQVKRILTYSLGYDENSATFLYLRKPNCSLDSGLVPLADALQDRNMLLTYAQSHQNRLHVYVSRVEISPLVVADQHKEEGSKKEKHGKPSCSKKLSVLAKLQKALDEEDILADQILTMMHCYADRFTNRRVEINNLMVLQDHPLVDYGDLRCGCDVRGCVWDGSRKRKRDSKYEDNPQVTAIMNWMLGMKAEDKVLEARHIGEKAVDVCSWHRSIDQGLTVHPPSQKNSFDAKLLLAVKDGVFVAQAAGNEGLMPKSIMSYSPWIRFVAAAIDVRRYRHNLTLENGKNAPHVWLEYFKMLKAWLQLSYLDEEHTPASTIEGVPYLYENHVDEPLRAQREKKATSVFGFAFRGMLLKHQWYMAEQEERLPMIEYMDLAKQISFCQRNSRDLHELQKDGTNHHFEQPTRKHQPKVDYFANNDLENNFTISDVGADEQMNRTLPWLSFTTKLNSVLKRVTTSKSEVNGG
ncbi:transposase, MuDR, MULE transposase domain protein [Tanacetum coccineum]|uniref:Transposase, MuDR, MULE transposase domain protein n=1 Tax=Tanacetum coccineum TaxID=301880 RepID=A0ABQ5GJH5_9ASTR